MKGIALIRVSTDSQDLQQQSDVVVKRMMDDGYNVKGKVDFPQIGF